MSETVSYNARTLNGKAGRAVLENLKSRGIFFRDLRAWATARERVEELHRKLQEDFSRCSPVNLGDGTGDLANQECTRAEAMLRAFCGVAAFKTYAEKTRGKDLEDLREGILFLRGKRPNLPKEMYSPLQIQERIESLASVVQKELCQVEKEALLTTVFDALADLGYRLERNGDSLKATMNRSCIWMETNEWGELSLDFSGFSGLSCLEEVKRTEEAFARKGITLTRTSSEFHGRPEGGILAGRLEILFPVFRRMDANQSQVTPCRPKIKIGG
jgi:hypothetical protein